MIIFLTAFAFITAVLTIRAQYVEHAHKQEYLFKPLTTILIVGVALLGTGETTGIYKTLIIVGMLFCLGGDIFLMLPEKYFIAGLGSFLVGHLFYLVAFSGDTAMALSIWLLPLTIYGAIVYGMLYKHLGKMRWPVLAYMVAIMLMACKALTRYSTLETTGAALAAAGAIFFVLSDSVLAFNKFKRPFTHARWITLATYWFAQWLIALSVGAYLLIF